MLYTPPQRSEFPLGHFFEALLTNCACSKSHFWWIFFGIPPPQVHFVKTTVLGEVPPTINRGQNPHFALCQPLSGTAKCLQPFPQSSSCLPYLTAGISKKTEQKAYMNVQNSENRPFLSADTRSFPLNLTSLVK